MIENEATWYGSLWLLRSKDSCAVFVVLRTCTIYGTKSLLTDEGIGFRLHLLEYFHVEQFLLYCCIVAD